MTSTEATLLEGIEELQRKEAEYSSVGKRVPKYDSVEKVTGKAEFLNDIKVRGMLYGKILRSRYPHARILRVDTSKAQRLPGVYSVITAKETPMVKIGYMKDNPPLKHDKVRSVRDEIAAVAASDIETAQRAIEAIDVKYEELPAVFDPLEAMKPSAPIIHEENGEGGNIARIPFSFRSGDVDSYFHKSDVVVEEEYKLQFITHTALGTSGALAFVDEKGNVNVYANTQAPFMYQRELADALGVPGSKVRIIQPYIGGAFGRGMDLYPVDVITALLAIKTRSPVKVVYSRGEEFSYSPTRQPAIIRLKQGVSKEGYLLARKAEVFLDVGAYVSWGAFDARVMMATTTGQYRVKSVAFDAYTIYTNNPSSGTMRGAGNPQMNFALESQMDTIADKVGMDPLELRIKNSNKEGDVTHQGMVITTCKMVESLKIAGQKIGWKGRHKTGRENFGIGFSTMFHVAGGARVYKSDGCGATIRIDDFGKVTVATGSSEIGTGSDTAICQIVAEEIGVPLERVELINKDTSLKPWDVGIHASRTTFVAGKAAQVAAREAKSQIIKVASETLGLPPSEIDIRDGFVITKANGKKDSQTSVKIRYEKVIRSGHFREGGNVVISSAFYDPQTQMADSNFMGNISMTYGFGTQAALVGVDEETGKVKVIKVVAVHDAGNIINPLGAEGQIEGGVVMSLGYALTENLILEHGSVVNSNFGDYKILTSADVPQIETYFVEGYDPCGPFGAKGLGEAGCIPTAAAIANAVYDATGARIRELPLTPEIVLNALAEVNKERRR
jgi:CO/xanthine dehydrogenase Mo-binding subunit